MVILDRGSDPLDILLHAVVIIPGQTQIDPGTVGAARGLATDRLEIRMQDQSTARIVIAEDAPVIRDLLVDRLESDRFDALPAWSMLEATRLCNMASPDLLLLDLKLVEDSAETVRSLRVNWPELGIILMAGRGTDVARVRGIEQGANDYVIKPFAYGELLARINATLRVTVN